MITSLGYTITTNYFEPIEKKDIYFDENIRNAHGSSDIYFTTFQTAYPKLERLLVNKEASNYGFAVRNDHLILADACMKHKLGKLKMTSYDVQRIFCQYTNRRQPPKLKDAMRHLGISKDGLTLHKSADDAQMTMLVFKQICENLGCAPEEVLQLYRNQKICIDATCGR